MLRVCSSFEFVASKFGCPKDIVEVGVRGGHNSVGILTTFTDVESVTLVDRYKSYDDELSGFIPDDVHLANLRHMIGSILPFGSKVTFLPTGSIRASQKLADNSFDFIYLDDDHDYQPVLDGMRNWYPKVKKGGFLADHDYDRKSVQLALSDFIKETKVDYIQIPRDYSEEHIRIPDWLLRKV